MSDQVRETDVAALLTRETVSGPMRYCCTVPVNPSASRRRKVHGKKARSELSVQKSKRSCGATVSVSNSVGTSHAPPGRWSRGEQP
jgi:hypothetical protein